VKSFLLSLTLLAASIPLWVQAQNEGISAKPSIQKTPPTEAKRGLGKDDVWLRELLGVLPPTSPVSNAAQFELLRWQEHPLLDGEILLLETQEAPSGAFSIQLEAVGAAPQILPWIQHLLRAPYSKGYLVDPTLLRIQSTDNDRLHLSFQVQILPAAVFLTGGQK
jgi:hypothetical protein